MVERVSTRLHLDDGAVALGVAHAVDAIIERYPSKTGQLLNVLNDVQEENRYLPEEAVERIAERMGVPVEQIVRMGDFFNSLSNDPVGRCIVEVCDGTACHTQGSARLVAEFEKKLGIKAGQTTEDGLITLRTVGCVGACGIAPVVVVEGEAYGRVRVMQVGDIAAEAFKRAEEVPVKARGDEERSALPAQSQCRPASEGGDSLGEKLATAASTGDDGKSESASMLETLCEKGITQLEGADLRVMVGMGTCGQAAGAREVLSALEAGLGVACGMPAPSCDDANELRDDSLGEGASATKFTTPAGVTISVDRVGCKGLCYAEPLIEVSDSSGRSIMFGRMDAAKATAFANALAAGVIDVASARVPNELAENLIDDSVLDLQERRVLSNCGIIEPTSIAQYVARGGYGALAHALEMPPADIVQLVIEANLRGRGGAGFPTGRKWLACTQNDADERFFIVNGDEGDPGAYMDRGLLESDPHRVLEGLIIGCFATGVHQAYFFIRAEYPLAVRTVRRAIADAYAVGLLGADVLGSGFSLDVEVVRGAGAFLCGESTAMVNVLENGECTTRHKPPHLTERGLWGKPTCINNVETLANVPLIVEKGATWFAGVGTQASPGTKIFSVTGAVGRGGLVEVPLGISLGAVVGDIACAEDPKAVQIGGPSGAILPATLSDLEMSFEGLSGINGMIGSGGFVVISREQCVVDTASYLVHFSARQSCRKCKPCGDGLDECAEIYERICAGEGTTADLERLQEVAERNCASKLCGLGRTSLSPVLSSLHYFREEYEAHLAKCCPGLTCTALISYVIDEKKCQGERCCLLTCPGNAVKGRFGKPGHIVGRLCQKCGMCAVSCPYGAVKKVSPAR